MARSLSRLPAGDLTARIRGHLPGLSGASRAIADHVLDDPAVIATYSISELAEATGTSPASVTRFCRAIGLSGYPQLRLSLAAEFGGSSSTLTNDLGTSIEIGDPVDRVAEIVATANALAVQHTIQQIDYAAVTAAGKAIVAASRVDLFGVGGSAIVCSELQLRLQRIGRQVASTADTHVAQMSVCHLRPGDVLVAVSRSGRTHEVLDVVEMANDRGATTVAITSFPNSPLARHADIPLITPVQDTNMRHGSLAVKYAQLLIADCVYSAVAHMTYEGSIEALAVTAQALASHRVSQRPRKNSRADVAAPADGA